MKVIIADDHPVVRQGLRQMLAVECDLTVGGEARNRQEVGDLSRRVPCEVAVLDYNMPGKNGLELALEVNQRKPDVPIILMSGRISTDADSIQNFTGHFGIACSLAKPYTQEQLMSSIRKALAGACGN